MGCDFLGNYHFGYVFLTGGGGPKLYQGLKKFTDPRIFSTFRIPLE